MASHYMLWLFFFKMALHYILWPSIKVASHYICCGYTLITIFSTGYISHLSLQSCSHSVIINPSLQVVRGIYCGGATSLYPYLPLALHFIILNIQLVAAFFCLQIFYKLVRVLISCPFTTELR